MQGILSNANYKWKDCDNVLPPRSTKANAISIAVLDRHEVPLMQLHLELPIKDSGTFEYTSPEESFELNTSTFAKDGDRDMFTFKLVRPGTNYVKGHLQLWQLQSHLHNTVGRRLGKIQTDLNKPPVDVFWKIWSYA
jgi:hypothetical protein